MQQRATQTRATLKSLSGGGVDHLMHENTSAPTPAPPPYATTTDGKPPRPGYENAPAPAPVNPATGQHEAYWVLSENERAKGFVRPLRTAYRHDRGCGWATSMGQAIAETYARNPAYYGLTMCVRCGAHFPVAQFKWDGTEERVGS